MNTYVTLVGQTIDLGLLPERERILAHHILALREKHEQELSHLQGTPMPAPAENRCDISMKQEDSGKKTAAACLERGRDIIRRAYLARQDYLEALHGPVGVVFRDGYFRLYAQVLADTK